MTRCGPDELRSPRGLRLRSVQASDWPLDFALSHDPAVVAGTSFPPRLFEQAAQERVARAVMRREDVLSCYPAFADAVATP